MAAPAYWTAEMVRELPEDGNRYEVVHGELLVTPAPRVGHQVLVTRIATALANYLERFSIGTVLVSPADISWGRRDVLVQPDVFVVPGRAGLSLEWAEIRELLLGIEVLSPSSLRADRFTKRRLYQEQAVPLYWVVDADSQQVEVWTPDVEFPLLERERLLWYPTGAGQPFVLPLGDLFRTA
jgi:Uma2 family endonuclease